jgi:hypothetical protein
MQGVWVAKDAAALPQLLIAPGTNKPGAAKLVLRHIEIEPQCVCSVQKQGDVVERLECIRVRCLTAEPELQDFFFRTHGALLESLGSQRVASTTLDALETVAELFRGFSNRPTKTLQGLWAELFLLSRARSIEAAAHAWQITSRALVDFVDGSEAVEVKSSATDSRRHHFKLEQLIPREGERWVVASFMLREDPSGTSLQQLWKRIEARLELNPSARMHVATQIAQALGDAWRYSESYRVDEESAALSVRFFDSRDVPRVEVGVNPAISDVQFVADLSGSPQVRTGGILFSNLFGSFTTGTN